MKEIQILKSNKAITIVSLVVTIIVLIILAGVSIGAIWGDNGIITVAKRAKENIEQAQIDEQTKLNELYTQIEIEGVISEGISYDAIAKLTQFKKVIAEAITNKGVETKETDSAETMANNIANLETDVNTDGTATAADIASGKTAWVNGFELTGTAQILNKSGSKNGGGMFVQNNSYATKSGKHYIFAYGGPKNHSSGTPVYSMSGGTVIWHKYNYQSCSSGAFCGVMLVKATSSSFSFYTSEVGSVVWAQID